MDGPAPHATAAAADVTLPPAVPLVTLAAAREPESGPGERNGTRPTAHVPGPRASAPAKRPSGAEVMPFPEVIVSAAEVRGLRQLMAAAWRGDPRVLEERENALDSALQDIEIAPIEIAPIHLASRGEAE
jgi:hypothetical protein